MSGTPSAPPPRTRRWALSAPARAVVATALLLCGLVLIGDMDSRADRSLHEAPIPQRVDHLLLPPVPLLRAMGLGQDTLVASLLWVKALAYFGEHFTRDRRYRWLETYVDTIADIDPRFRKLYEWAGVVVMYGGRIDNRAVRASIHILERGVEAFPDDWQLSFMVGCNYAFELRAANKEQKQENIKTALTYLRRASYAPGAPAYMAGFVSSLYERVGWLEAAAAYLQDAYLQTEDEGLREQVGLRLSKYRGDAEVERLRQATEAFDAQWKADFPYLPKELFRHVGSRSSGRVGDWHSLLEASGSLEDDERLVEQLADGDELVGIGLREGAPLEPPVPAGRPPVSPGAEQRPPEGGLAPR